MNLYVKKMYIYLIVKLLFKEKLTFVCSIPEQFPNSIAENKATIITIHIKR